MGDLGFGSPTTLDPDEPFDKGFGSPTAWEPAPDDVPDDLGFGSPLSVKVAFLIDETKVPDEGGAILRAYSEWTHSGPYRVRFVDSLGGEHPDVGGAYAGKPGLGESVYTQPAGDVLQFVAPPLAPGTYDVRIYDGIQFENVVVELEDAVDVVVRMRDLATYRVRNRFQSLFRTGPRALDRDVAATGPSVDVEFPKGMLETLTHALGQAVQEVVEGPVTVLAQDLVPGATTAYVESTLGWPLEPREPVSAWVIGPRDVVGAHPKLTYAHATDVELQDIVHDRPLVSALPRGTPLVLDVASVLPEEVP